MKYLFFTAFFFPFFCLAQNPDFPEILESDFDMRIDRHEYFDGSSLWGLINGGADIYLEYGMEKMLLEELSSDIGQLRVEIYKMNDPASAYGIFSLMSGNDTLRIPGAHFQTTVSNYQIKFAKGRYYGSVILYKSNEKLKALAINVVKRLASKIIETAYVLPEFFTLPIYIPYSNSIKYFKGPLGIQNGALEWLPVFEGLKDFEVFYLHIKKQNLSAEVAFIRINDTVLGVNLLDKNGFKFKTSNEENLKPQKIMRRFNSNYYQAMIISGEVENTGQFLNQLNIH